MLFKPEQKQLIEEKWQEVLIARGRCGNLWQESWQLPFDALLGAVAFAIETDAPTAWSDTSLRGRQLRTLMSEADGEETNLYLKLVMLTDRVEEALDQAATPANLIPRGELRELIDRIDRQNELIAHERLRTSTWHQDQVQRLDKVEEHIKEGKRTILHIEELSLVSLGIDELVSAIKDGVIAIRNGIDLLNDDQFTEQLRQGARKLWQTTKRFFQSAKQRFTAFRLPWKKDTGDDEIERSDPTFGLPPDDKEGVSLGISILIRNGRRDRKEYRVPRAGIPFQDTWEGIGGERIAGPQLVAVPSGEFMMGSSDVRGDADERPHHKVYIPKPFAIGRFPVTFAEWDTYLREGGGGKSPDDEGRGREDQPVMNVTWEDVQSYTKWLSKAVDKYYRLPTEAEWEYAARAGTLTSYFCGDSAADIDDFAWHRKNAKGQTFPVGQKKPNDWGLYDVHGAVWEWVEDTWHDNYNAKPEALKDNGGAWTERGERMHVIRGGSWYDAAPRLRSANRIRSRLDEAEDFIGFRVARHI